MQAIAAVNAMPASPDFQLISITSTVGAAEDAQRLAAALVDQRLAACVQVDGPMQSHYHWDGKPCCEPEWRLTLKTTASRLPAIEAFMATQHPYELPQLLWQPVSASAAYARWVREQVDGS